MMPSFSNPLTKATDAINPIPIIDCSAGIENCAKKIVDGLANVGIVYLVNHGISNHQVFNHLKKIQNVIKCDLILISDRCDF